MANEQFGTITGHVDDVGSIGGHVDDSGSISGGVEMPAVVREKDYEELDNKPQVNGNELIGNKSSEELNISACKTSAEWARLTQLVSVKGEVYVYTDAGTDESGNPVPKVKIGDGRAYVVDLPFVAATDLRITAEDIANWNNKIAVRTDGELLIFY